MNNLVSIGKAADQLGVCEETLRQWDREGKLVPVKTAGNHRRYRMEDIEKFFGTSTSAEDKKNSNAVAIYCRVSSHEQKQKGDLERQVGRVSSYCVKKEYNVIKLYEEVGSGMCDTRSKLTQLFRLVESHKISKVIVEHRDRLCRFMFEFLVSYFGSHGVEIEWVDEILGKSYEQELVEDILSLMSSFSAKIYGKRSAENRKRKKALQVTENGVKSTI